MEGGYPPSPFPLYEACIQVVVHVHKCVELAVRHSDLI